MIISPGKNNQGQTLLETILAIGLLTTVVIGCLGLGIYSIRIGRFSQNQLIAANLAREGIEYVRNIRDSNWLKESDGVIIPASSPAAVYRWDTGLDGCSSNWCTLNFDPTFLNYPAVSPWTLAPLNGHDIDGCTSAECELKIDNTYFTYNLNPAGTPSGFRRVIQISTLGPNKQVVVKVKWFENNQAKYLTLYEILSDWRP